MPDSVERRPVNESGVERIPMRIRRRRITSSWALSLILASPMIAYAAPASAAAAPALELPFKCNTSWTGNSGDSNAHRNNEIDFNLASGEDDRGEPVLAAAAGTIRWEGGEGSDYGNFLEIDHGNGYSTLYAHLDDKLANSGEAVKQGEQIGTVGNTDDTPDLSPHLHFEFRNRGSGQDYPEYIRPASFHGNPFDYETGEETFVSQNCGAAAPTTLPGLSVISRAVGSLDVFAVTNDYRLKWRTYVNERWTCWSSLPSNARIKGDPAAVATNGRIDVFAQGTDNRLKKITWTTAGNWGNWGDLGEYTITSSPAVTSRSSGGVDVFVKSAANKIVYRNYSTADENWAGTSWADIGLNAGSITATSAPAVVASADGARMNVLARHTDGSLLTLMWTKAFGWYNWVDRGGDIIGRPAASTRAGNSIDIFLRDHDNSLIHRFSPDGDNYTSHPPTDFGGYLTTSPTSVSWNNQRIDIFSRNVNADLIQKAWTPAEDWYPWGGHGPIGSPAC
jgi:hypothetical protein